MLRSLQKLDDGYGTDYGCTAITVLVCWYCIIKQDVWILSVNHLVKARNNEVIKVADGKVIQNNQIYSEL